MYPHVLIFRHWVIEVIVDHVRHQVAGPFAGVGYDGVEMDIKVEKSDCWVSRIAVVGEFVATDCQENAVRFSLWELDVVDKVGIGFFVFGGGVFGDKEDGISPINVFGGEIGFTPTLC